MNNLNYKINIAFLEENLTNFEKLKSDIGNDDKFRFLTYQTIQDFLHFSKNRKTDILITDFDLWEKESNEKKVNISCIHNDIIIILIAKQKSNFKHKQIDKKIITILLKEPLIENELKNTIDTANKISKILSTNRKNELLLANNRYDEILESISYDGIKKNIVDEKMYFGEILEANKQMLKTFSFFLNDINHTNNKVISKLFEKELPDILKIKKFSIFIVNKEFSSLNLFSSKNFHGDKYLKIPLNGAIDKNIMFDSLYFREAIYLSDFKKSNFLNKKNNGYSKADCLCIPLVSGKKVIGVANFNDSQFDFFTKHQTEIIQIFTSYFSVFADRNLLTKTF